MKIIITGSLGNVSKPLAETLVQKKHSVIVVSSNRDRQKDIEALGATAAIGSVEDIDFLTTVFTGADAVYTMIPPNFTAADPIEYYKIVGNSYAKAIQQAGIKRIVHLSSWGAHLSRGTGVIVGSHEVEKIFDELPGNGITYLRACSFYNNLYHYIGMIRGAGFIGTNYGGDNKIVLVSPEDIAAVAAEELELRVAAQKIRYVASDEHTCNEIAAALGIAIGKPDLKWVAFTDEQTQAAMEKNGIPSTLATLLVELNVSIRTGLIRQDYDLHKPIMGKIKLEDFANQFAAAFKQN